jgi:hypothetical protein
MCEKASHEQDRESRPISPCKATAFHGGKRYSLLAGVPIRNISYVRTAHELTSQTMRFAPDPQATLREFREYFASSYEALGKLAARVGVTHLTLADLLANGRRPLARTIAKLRAFLDAEGKRNAGGEGIKPTEPVPMKVLKPTRYSLYMRLCPFSRKERS